MSLEAISYPERCVLHPITYSYRRNKLLFITLHSSFNTNTKLMVNYNHVPTCLFIIFHSFYYFFLENLSFNV